MSPLDKELVCVALAEISERLDDLLCLAGVDACQRLRLRLELLQNRVDTIYHLVLTERIQ